MATNFFLFLSIIIGIIVIGLGIAVYLINRKQKREPDYRVFFTLGLVWLPLGIVFFTTMSNPAFLGLGLVFILIGLAKRDKWNEQSSLPPKKKKLVYSLIVGTALLVLITLGVFVFNTGLFP